ncbi:16560_t:CDS:2, partial [Dentiscutata heterogama]
SGNNSDHSYSHSCGHSHVYSCSRSYDYSYLCSQKNRNLPNSSSLIIEIATEKQQNLESNNIEGLEQILELKTANNISSLAAYINDNEIIPTEEILNDKQIINLAM